MERLIPPVKHKNSSDLNTISDFAFSDLVDISDLQQLINNLAELSGLAVGILDTDNNILASSGWKKICSNFHRVHPATIKHCLEKNNLIKQNLETKNPIA